MSISYNRKNHNIVKIIKISNNFVPSSSKKIGQEMLVLIKNQSWIWNENLNPNFEKDFIDLIELIKKSKIHKNYSFFDIFINFIPPLLFNQYQIYRKNSIPVAYISVGFLSDSIEEYLFYRSNSIDSFNLIEYKNGKNNWIIDLIAPDGDIIPVIKLLNTWAKKEKIPNGTIFKWKRIYSTNKYKFVQFTYNSKVWDIK